MKPLTKAEQATLKRLEGLSDESIDTGDAPEAKAGSRVWTAKDRQLFRPVKRAVTIRLDADVVAYFEGKAGGRGWQTLINESLRKVMIAEHL